MKNLILSLSILFTQVVLGQHYTSYQTGNTTDVVTFPKGGVCMMGGASEHDEAMKWFLNRANGGDVLVLRASGSDGYNNYMYSSLGVTLNSVETIVFNSSNAANDVYIHEKIQKAEAIWFAGGDQWDYISYWRDTPIDSLINKGIAERHIAIGGTSAGMAILGRYYFSAENGTITSATALSNPFHNNMTVDSTTFLKSNFLEDVITDSHYDDPDRKGRHTAFLARIKVDYDIAGKGIACNEYTSVCIDTNGIARVYGDYPNYDEDAYFIQMNCELSDIDKNPENCAVNSPLTWSVGQEVLKVYKVHGTNSGSHTFDLNTWEAGSGGEWQTWYIEDGVLFKDENSSQPNCEASIFDNEYEVSIYPNPTNDNSTIYCSEQINSITVHDMDGTIVFNVENLLNHEANLKFDFLPKGYYLLEIETENHNHLIKKLVKT